MQRFLDVAEQAARLAGKLLREQCGKVAAREKAPRDFVTEADLASQRLIFDTIHQAFPDHEFLGEEEMVTTSGGDEPLTGSNSNYLWIVDPLDGTLNYVHQLPNYSVSIGLRRGDEVVAGVVYDPVLDECFTALAGEGARLNGQAIQASEVVRLDEALVAVSMPTRVQRDSVDVRRLINAVVAAQSFRRQGSAALNLCYVALGRLDAYWATSVKIWDVAAGQLIAREAGACLTGIDGRQFDLDHPRFVVAATDALHAELLPLLES